MKEQQISKIGEEQFFAIFDNLVDGLMVFDGDNNLCLINSAALKIFEINEKDILNKSIEDFSDVPLLRNLFYLLGKNIKEVFRKELDCRENLILEITSSSILQKDKRVSSLIILHNITREKQIEKTKNNFVTVSAHQLRTPLSAIRWSLERLSQSKAGKLTEEQKELLGRVSKENKRMVSVVNELLNLVKIEEGRYLYKFNSFSIEKLVQSVVEYYEELIKGKEIKFEFQVLDRKMSKVKIDAGKIEIVIRALIDNAIRYTFPGGTIKIALGSKKKEIEFSIMNTGIGIPKDQQQNIFKKFFRASNAMKMDTEGNGNQLFIARNIIEAHKGKIWFESEEDKRTIFYFNLPL